MSSFTLSARHARRMPDPTFPNVTRHILTVPTGSFPEGMPFGANPRERNLDRMVYRDVEDSLLSGDGAFHLKHKGITIVADSVDYKDGSDQYVLHFKDERQGILDGGHSYEILVANLDADLEKPQYVKVDVLTGLDPNLIPDIAGGLNTSVQVQKMSLDNMRGCFDWIQAELKDTPYFKRIAWVENVKDAAYDARDIVAFLHTFNIFNFPTGDMTRFPMQAYTSKAAVLVDYERNQEQYLKLRPILKDILVLADTISYEARNLYNETGGRAGRSHLVEHRSKQFDFTFIGKHSQYRLMTGALFPMLGAFRWMVEVNPKTGEAQWKRPFPEIIDMWRELASDMFTSSMEMGRDLGYNPNALGKNKSHWGNLFRAVVVKDLMNGA